MPDSLLTDENRVWTYIQKKRLTCDLEAALQLLLSL